MTGVDIVGLDPGRVDKWLASVTEASFPLTWQALTGGHSNLTYRVSDAAGRRFVIRRPPLGKLAPRAHDMWREFRILTALWPTVVAVPQPIAYCDDRDVAETHLYVMASSDGRALLSGSATDEWLDLRARQRAADAFVTALVALHSVDPEVIGLGDLGRAEGYVARQLSTWYQSWTTATNRACYDDDRAHTLHATLSERIPDSSPARLVHGDYGPHNTLFVSSGEISAVLDWEIATLGDPLVDLAYAVNGWVGPGDEKADLADPPTRRPGFPDRQVIIDRYAEKAGADLSNFTFYRVFNYWRRACILQGVYGRYRAGQRQGSDGDANAVRRRIPILLKAAVDLGAKFDGRSW